MVLNNVVAAVVVLTLLLVQDAGQLWLVYLVIAAYAASSYLTAAAQGGLLRDLMPDRLLAPANGLLSTVDQGLRIVSPLAGAGVFALWGMAPVIAATCVCFLAAAAVILTVRVNEAQHGPKAGETFWTSSLAGFHFLWRHQLLRPATMTLMIAVAATGILNVTLFASIDQGVGLPPESLAVFSSVQGIFSVLGGLTAASVIRVLGLQRTMGLGLVLLGAAIPLLASNSVALVPGGGGAGGLRRHVGDHRLCDPAANRKSGPLAGPDRRGCQPVAEPAAGDGGLGRCRADRLRGLPAVDPGGRRPAAC